MEKIIRILLCTAMLVATQARTVVDPAVYLSPSPPLLPAAGEDAAQQRFAPEPRVLGLQARTQEELRVLPLKKDDSESMDSSETLWSGYEYRQPEQVYMMPVGYGYGYGGVAAGSYPGSGLSAGFAGSAYSTFGTGTRVPYSGWGNGQWGHYGSS